MKSALLRSLLALAVGYAAACSDDKRDPSQWPIGRDELTKGAKSNDDSPEVTYRRYCIGCHGVDGRGNGGITGADLTAADSPLTSREDAELIASIRDGKQGKTATMPPHKPVLNDAQIAEVVGYLRQRFQKPAQ